MEAKKKKEKQTEAVLERKLWRRGALQGDLLTEEKCLQTKTVEVRFSYKGVFGRIVLETFAYMLGTYYETTHQPCWCKPSRSRGTTVSRWVTDLKPGVIKAEGLPGRRGVPAQQGEHHVFSLRHPPPTQAVWGIARCLPCQRAGGDKSVCVPVCLSDGGILSSAAAFEWLQLPLPPYP